MASTTVNNSISTLTPTEAMVLQQVHEDGEDDPRTLAHMLGMSRQHVLNIIAHLKHKGLIAIDGGYDGLWVHLTNKGRRLISYLWPESRSVFA